MKAWKLAIPVERNKAIVFVDSDIARLGRIVSIIENALLVETEYDFETNADKIVSSEPFRDFSVTMTEVEEEELKLPWDI